LENVWTFVINQPSASQLREIFSHYSVNPEKYKKPIYKAPGMAGSHHVCSEEKQYKTIEMHENIQSNRLVLDRYSL